MVLQNELSLTVEYNNNVPEVSVLVTDTVDVMGVDMAVNFVYVNGAEHTEFSYDESTKVSWIGLVIG